MKDALTAVLAPQVQAGLVGIHLSVRPGPGITADKVMAEFLEAEQAIAEGRLRQPPGPTGGVTPEVARVIAACAL